VHHWKFQWTINYDDAVAPNDVHGDGRLHWSDSRDNVLFCRCWLPYCGDDYELRRPEAWMAFRVPKNENWPRWQRNLRRRPFDDDA